MKNISIYPHYGFVNTNFIISSKSQSIDAHLKIMPEGQLLNLPPCDGYIAVKFLPGEHQIHLLDSNNNILQCENIYVDDAIKIGGSVFSGKFVLPDWIVIVMKDRSYFRNIHTSEEFMEYKIHPDNILQITSNILLFEEKNYYNFFSMDTMESIAIFHRYEIIFYNENIIIHKSNNNEIFIIRNYIDKQLVTYDEFIFHEQAMKLYIHDKTENLIQIIDLQNKDKLTYLSIPSGFLFLGFTNKHYAVFSEDKKYYMTDLDNKLAFHILPICEILNYYSKSNYIDFKVNKNDIRINDNLRMSLIGENSILVEESKIRIEQVSSYMTCECRDVWKHIITDLNNIKPISLNNSQIYFQDDQYIVFSDSPYEISNIEVYNIKKKEIRAYQNVKVFKFNQVCLFSTSKDEINAVYSINGNLLIDGKKISIDNSLKQSGLIKVDNSFYCYIDGEFKKINIDYHIGRNIVSKDSGFYYMVKGKLRPLPYKLDNFSGNEDCLLYEENEQWNLLVWDHANGKYIHSTLFSNFDRHYYKNAMFCEDGNQLLCQKKDNTFCFYNILTGETIPFDLETSVQRNFNANQLFVSNYKNRRIVFKDPISLKPITPECLSLYRFSSFDGRYNIGFNKANSLVQEELLVSQDGKKERVKYFEINDTVENKFIKIYPIKHVKYINYVSFSYNSNIVAFVGATPSVGFILIYDLASGQTLFEYPSDKNLGFASGAIWIVSFNLKGELAIYNSNPTTYIFSPDEDYKSFKSISSRNFLCFSPSGNYMALSTQGYNAWAYGTNNKWGHQKSTKIFIRKTNESNMELGPLEIFGNAEIPRTNQNNVGSVAFSLDENKILVVLNDGTIVVKNIQLQDNALWENKVKT